MTDISALPDAGAAAPLASPLDATLPDHPGAAVDSRIRRGTRSFRLTNLALFSAGFSTFALIYCVQPLMPVFSQEFGIGPAQSSLALSATTGTLAFAMLVASSLSEIVGRKPVMVTSLLVSALLMMASAFVRDWNDLVVLRALAGIAFSGLPAVAMAYVSEEMHTESVGLAMGLYIGGSGLGGLGGRAIAGVVADFVSWRTGLFAVGVVGVACALVLWRTLPASRNFRRSSPSVRVLAGSFAGHLRDGGLRALFLQGFLLLGSFVCVYNYTGYRLMQPPFSLSQISVSFIFAVYLVGIVSSAYIGDLAVRLGRGPILCLSLGLMLVGVLATLAPWLPVIVLGMAVLTAGFFGAHSTASSWVGARAHHAKAQASSLYLFAYYLGSSVVGTLGGVFWTGHGWHGVVMLISGLLVAGFACACWLVALTSGEQRGEGKSALGPSSGARVSRQGGGAVGSLS
ncbi:MFS transporter [Ancylobacter sp. MQZ15Z-1]|uniref:MFS transporter n=1 Tax=Ancylobacter mangrovi TaxID=2972472 RepID=A0A9X2PDA5_9HYPH|nr:MFS transporter [Ancylobacter mangrovi]MCS0495289.1 MFS transporter [Ancylobacter mangrovi]